MSLMSVILFAASVSVAELGSLTDTDRVVTNVSDGVAFSITNSETRAVVSHGESFPRIVVSENASGSQTYLHPTNNAFIWIPEDSDLRFGGASTSGKTVVGSTTVGFRIHSAVSSATNGVVRFDSDEWSSITNRINSFNPESITETVDEGSYINTYTIRASGTITKESKWVHDVSHQATSQAIVSVEYPMYVFMRGPTHRFYLLRGYWKGPFYKKVPGLLQWKYDPERTSSSLEGYDSSMSVSSDVRNMYFGSQFESYSKAYTFVYDSSYLTAGVKKSSSAYWQGSTSARPAGSYLKLGGSVSFIDAVKGTNSEEYVGFGDTQSPNVISVYTNRLWYLDRSVGSGEYYTYTADIPYTWYETVTTHIGTVSYCTVVSDVGTKLSVGDHISYERQAVSGTDSWNLILKWTDTVFHYESITLDLPYRGLNSLGYPVWSYHDDRSKWNGNPESEYGTVVWNSDESKWMFTGGLDAWRLWNGVHRDDDCRPVVLVPGECSMYPCNDFGFTGTVKIVSESGTQYLGRFEAEYTRNVPASYATVTNTLASVDFVSNIVDDVALKKSINVGTNDYSAGIRLLNGMIMNVYEKEGE